MVEPVREPEVVERSSEELPAADLRAAAVVVVLAMAGATIELFLARWRFAHPGLSPLGIAFTLWILSPHALLLALTRRAAPDPDRAGLHFGGCLLVGSFGVAACWYGFDLDPGAQNGMLPLVVPLWQWIGATALAGGLHLLPDRSPGPGSPDGLRIRLHPVPPPETVRDSGSGSRLPA